MCANYIAPDFVQPFRGARLRQGGSARFVAVVAADPVPNVLVWTKDGQVLPHDEDKHEQYFCPATGEIGLIIHAFGPGDEGSYTCRYSLTQRSSHYR